MTKLKIADNLSLPLDFVTSTQVILAQKGKGKSYLASVQAEELLDAKQQVVAVDPTGAWYGLRSSPDGKSTGYPIAVLGGEHADVALEPTAGEVIAEAIATEHFSAIIDLTLFRKNEALRFMAAFLETLYRKNREPLHLFIDEADVVAPQKTWGPEQARVLGAAEDIVRRGRIRGIGCTLITQRPQVLNKDVLTQADMLTTLGMSHPKDLGAIEAWVAVHGDPAKAKTMIASLPSLPRGDAWVWNPSIDLFKRVTIRTRTTFDSGRTPKSGERKVEAKVLAPVDIARLGKTIASTVERQKQNDPAMLKLELARTQKALAVLEAGAEQSIRTQLSPPKTAIKDAQIKRVEKLIEKINNTQHEWFEATKRAGDSLRALLDRADGQVLKLSLEAGILGADLAKAQPNTKTSLGDRPVRAGGTTTAKATLRTPSGHPTLTHQDLAQPSTNGLGKAELRILEACAWAHLIGLEAPDSVVVAFLAGYTVNGHFTNIRGKLHSAGLVEYPSPGTLRLTPDGEIAAPEVTRPVTTAELHRAVLERLKSAHRKILVPLIEAWPATLTTGDAADRAGFTVNGHFTNIRGRLHSMGLITYPSAGTVRAADLLFPETSRHD